MLATRAPEATNGDLVRSAAASDPEAWQALVDRFSGMVWSIARAYGLDRTDAADVAQTVWLRLVDHLDRLREPDRVGAWLAATARHESIRVSRQRNRTMPAADPVLAELAGGTDDESATSLVESERDAALWRVVTTLPERSQALVRMLMADPPVSYTEVAAGLGMPIGSIGPTRQRTLRTLRARCAVAGIEL